MPKQILVVDDELHILVAVRAKLSSVGYDVVTCNDGEEAWEQIQTDLPDLLISDYAMPRLDGLQLCERIRNCPRSQNLPIFLLTGKWLDKPLRDLVKKFGVLDLIPKPFSSWRI